MHWKIDENLRVIVLGLGYVGLPTAMAFSKKYLTIGVDVKEKLIANLTEGFDKTGKYSREELSENKKLKFFSEIPKIDNRSVFIVTVPTPVDEKKEPDLSLLIEVSRNIGRVLKKGDVVVYESTTFPGCTEEICIPELERNSGLQLNRDFGVGYSPERLSPGSVDQLENIVRVVSGSNEASLNDVSALYQSILNVKVYRAQSIKVAEAAKLVENCQRDVNISFVNELALIFDKMGIQANEVLDAARTKWNFLDFKPGLVGGHCISVDPYYMIHKAKKLGYEPKVIGAGRLVNEEMGKFMAHRSMKIMTSKGLNLIGLKVLVLGFAYKENCSDFRNTKVLDLVEELRDFGLNVCIYDPLVDKEEVLINMGFELLGKPKLEDYSVAIIAVNHKEFERINFERNSLLRIELFN